MNLNKELFIALAHHNKITNSGKKYEDELNCLVNSLYYNLNLIPQFTV